MTKPCIQETRISKLEAEMTGHDVEIINLVKRLDDLIKGIWALVLVLIPTAATGFGFMIWQLFGQRGG